MNGDFQIRTQWDVDVLTDGPDALYHALDGLFPDGGSATVEPVDPDGTSVEAVANADGSLVVRFKANPDGPVEEVAGADVFGAHQALLAYVGREADWASRFRVLRGSFGSLGVGPRLIDYQGTGLTIATAMIDKSKRGARLGLEKEIPPVIRWGADDVVTGDLWRGVPATGAVLIQVKHQDLGRENGIAINIPGGSIAGPGKPASTEVVIWPQVDGRELRFEYNAPKGLFGVCNVYLVGNENWSRVDRWGEDAGMIARTVSRNERSYRCNHASSRPPTFRDIEFTVSLVAA